MSTLRGLPSLVVLLLWLTTPLIAQEDGVCTVNLDVSPIRDALQTILEDEGVINEVADYGIAAPFSGASPVTNGEIAPGEYANTCFFSFADRENPGNPYPSLDTIDANGDGDLSLFLHLSHTDEYLFLGFEAIDEFLDLDEGVNAFTNDSVELFINSDIVPDDFNPDTIGRNNNAEGWQLVADAAGSGGPGDWEFNNRTSATDIFLVPADPDNPPIPGEEMATAGVPTDTGWVVEWMIPLASLDTDSDDAESITPAETGDVMLFNFAINDNDEEGAAGQDTHAMLWVVEEDPRSPFGGGENVWVVPLQLTPGGDPGDFNGDASVDGLDIDELTRQSAAGTNDLAYDLNGDALVDDQDIDVWITSPDIFNSWMGDANLDGEFNSGDLVTVLASGTYEADVDAVWSTGDFDGNGRANTADLVTALAGGGYEVGPRPAVANVPEPSCASLILFGLLAVIRLSKTPSLVVARTT